MADDYYDDYYDDLVDDLLARVQQLEARLSKLGKSGLSEDRSRTLGMFMPIGPCRAPTPALGPFGYPILPTGGHYA